MKQIYSGLSNKELKEYNLKGIPIGKRFTTDIFMAKKFGNNIISVNYNKKKFILDSQSDIFFPLGTEEKYYFNAFPIKRFKKLVLL